MSSTYAGKSGRGLLLTAINAVAVEGVSFKQSDITFAAPEVVSHNGLATRVVFTATPESLFTGSKEIFFNRVDLEAMFTNAGILSVEVNATDVPGNTVAEVIAALNVRYGTEFEAGDYVAEQIEPGSDSVIVRAAAGSFGYVGELIVNLIAAETPVEEVVPNGDLGDITPPVPVEPV
jgi:hypothetical protein